MHNGRKGEIFMKRKWLAVVTMITVLSMALTGCSNGKDNPVEEETTEEETIEEAESGTVALKVWGEEDTLDMLSDMVESFKEHYANEARRMPRPRVSC